MPHARQVSIDIVMPTYNNQEELRAALEALRTSSYSRFRVLVCVDGSTDGTAEYLATTHLPFSLQSVHHTDGANHGRSSARNLALEYISADYVLLMDSDMRLVPEALGQHVALIERRDCISVGDVQYLNATENPWARYLATRGKNKYATGSTIRPLDFVTANSAMRSEHLLALGGFDETLVGYGGEDTEFAFRLAARGIPFIFNAQARALTVEPKSIDEGLRELRRYAQTNLRTIRSRYPDAPAPFRVDLDESTGWRGRLFRALLNPITDRIVDGSLSRVPWAIQRRLLNYKVIRAVFAGYREGAG